VTGSDRIRRCVAVYLTALVVFWTLAIVGQLVRAHWLGHEFAWKSLLLKNAKDAFGDFTIFDPVTERFSREPGGPPLVYPAPMVCGYLLFTRFFTRPLAVYEGVIAGIALTAALTFAYFLGRGTRQRWLLALAVGVSLLLSLPLMFAMERANMEPIVWLVQILAVAAFVMRRNMTAGLLMALAASMKLYPALLLLLLLSRKKYKELAVSIAALVPITLVALWIVGPSVRQANADIAAGMAILAKADVFQMLMPDLGFDHSLFSFVKQAIRIRFPGDFARIQAAVAWAAIPYALAAGMAFAALYWFRIRKLPMLNQLVALCILSTLLPPIALEYTLIQVYIPWAVFLMFLVRDRVSIPFPAAAGILGCFAFVFAPAAYLSGTYVGFGGQVKACAMLAIVLVLCRYPLPSSVVDDLPQIG
jgi:hypothetical protein